MNDIHAQRVSEVIRMEIARKRLSRVTLARQIGMGHQAFSRRYVGAVAWSVSELLRLAVALEVSPENLLLTEWSKSERSCNHDC